MILAFDFSAKKGSHACVVFTRIAALIIINCIALFSYCTQSQGEQVKGYHDFKVDWCVSKVGLNNPLTKYRRLTSSYFMANGNIRWRYHH